MSSLTCTRCEGSGFLNLHQISKTEMALLSCPEAILSWMRWNTDSDVQVCDCCGDGEAWHGESGEHYNESDPSGNEGPYAYNGGLCECH